MTEGLSSVKGFRGAPVTLEVAGLKLPAWITVYRAPLSYTREDVVEISLPGSLPLVGLLVRALLDPHPADSRAGGVGSTVPPKARWARPGEFTLRAFLKGRLDLAQAEAVAILIGATGEAEGRAALRGLHGELGRELEKLSAGILEALALLEAALDFPDEDLPQVSPAVLLERVIGLLDSLRALKSSTALRAPRDGDLRVVLAGFPNAGKSSLLNQLLGREAAIASELEGTTRDPVHGVTVQEGRRVEWVDVAGARDIEALLREPGEPGGIPEKGGLIWEVVRRLTRLELEAADIILWVADPTQRLEESLEQFRRLKAPQKTLVLQKSDLLAGPAAGRLEQLPEKPLLVSAKERRGIGALIQHVLDATPGRRAGFSALPAAPQYLISAHQEVLLAACEEALVRAASLFESGLAYEYAAADLRLALQALEDLSGKAPREAVLDLVFSRFCIGK
jgi:tRNA modification GTPase